jgi:hypothetical protein
LETQGIHSRGEITIVGCGIGLVRETPEDNPNAFQEDFIHEVSEVAAVTILLKIEVSKVVLKV